jgi:hypothetical protein
MANIQNVSSERRRQIVQRFDGGVSRITAAEIQNADELAFAIRWLADHFMYKRSKVHGVNSDAASQTFAGIDAGLASFLIDVVDAAGLTLQCPEDEVAVHQPVSQLGQGVVRNPFHYL